MSKRDAIEKMAAEGERLLEREKKKAFWNQRVTCVLCNRSVRRKNTVLLKGELLHGPACRTHQGIS